MCADYTPSCKEHIEDSFRTEYLLRDLPPEAWLEHMAPMLCGTYEAPGELEIAPAMFCMVPQLANHMLVLRKWPPQLDGHGKCF